MNSIKNLLKTSLLALINFQCLGMEGLSINHHNLLQASLHQDCLQVKQFIAKGDDVNQKNAEGETPLTLALYITLHDSKEYENAQEIVTDLLRAGASVNTQNNRGEAALHLAAMYGLKSIAQHLLENGATPNIVDQFNATPLLKVAQGLRRSANALEAKKAIFKLLLENRADPKIAGIWGETPQKEILQSEYLTQDEKNEFSDLIKKASR